MVDAKNEIHIDKMDRADKKRAAADMQQPFVFRGISYSAVTELKNGIFSIKRACISALGS